MSVSRSSGAAAISPSDQKPTSGGPAWDPKRKRQQTQLRFVLLMSGVAAIAAAVVSWVFTRPITAAEVKPLQVGVNLTLILAPVLAASAGVERFLETIFSVIEGNARTLVAYLGRGLRWLHNAETEVENAREWLANISAAYAAQLETLPNFSSEGQAPTSVNLLTDAQKKLKEAKDLMALAEQRLETAEEQLNQVTDSDGYKNAKRAASICIGLLLGLMVAAASSLQMFALMGVKVGDPRIDVFVTGLVIGCGSTPVHSLINILQSAKDTLDSAQGWLDRARPS